MKSRVPLRLVEYAIKSEPSDFINEIDSYEIVACVDHDEVDRSPQDRRLSIAILDPTRLEVPRRL